MRNTWVSFDLTWADISFDQKPQPAMIRESAPVKQEPVYQPWQTKVVEPAKAEPVMMTANDVLFGAIEKA